MSGRLWGSRGEEERKPQRHVGAVTASRSPHAIGQKLILEHRLHAHSHSAPVPRETSRLIREPHRRVSQERTGIDRLMVSFRFRKRIVRLSAIMRTQSCHSSMHSFPSRFCGISLFLALKRHMIFFNRKLIFFYFQIILNYI